MSTNNPAASGAAPADTFDGYLCRAFGESDRPIIELVRDLAGVRAFLIETWLGEEDSTAYDGSLMLPGVMEDIEAHPWDDEPAWSIAFEIGGISVEKISLAIHGAALASREASPAPLTDERASLEIDAVVSAAREWTSERMPEDWMEEELMKAVIRLDGDWKGCDECDHQCDEPCMPATVPEMLARIDSHMADLVHAGKVCTPVGYVPPEGWKPTIRIKRAPAAALASPQVAPAPVPEGFALVPLRLTREMERIVNEEDWQWSDLLAAAETVDEDAENWYTKADEAIEGMKIHGFAWDGAEWRENAPEVATPVQVAPDQRNAMPAFEAWYCSDGNYEPEELDKLVGGACYANADTENMWQAWQGAFIRLAAPVQVAPANVMDELRGFVETWTLNKQECWEGNGPESVGDAFEVCISDIKWLIQRGEAIPAPVAPQDDARDAADLWTLVRRMVALHEEHGTILTVDMGALAEMVAEHDSTPAAKPTEEQGS